MISPEERADALVEWLQDENLSLYNKYLGPAIRWTIQNAIRAAYEDAARIVEEMVFGDDAKTAAAAIRARASEGK
jgi:hypothetical protein